MNISNMIYYHFSLLYTRYMKRITGLMSFLKQEILKNGIFEGSQHSLLTLR